MTCKVLAKSPSLGLHKWKQVQYAAQLGQALLGLFYCIAAATNSDPVMDAAVYGNIVTSVQAEWWSYPTLVFPLIYIIGIEVNGNWRWSPAVRMLGAAGSAGLCAAFSFLAYTPGPWSPFVLITGGWSILNLWFLWINLGDTLRAVRLGNCSKN